LVHGSVSDHTVFAPLEGELRDEFTIFAMDRRGFGASRDDPGYSAEPRIQRRCGGRGCSRGADWGAGGAIRLFLGRELRPGAARDLPSLRALVLYEPSLGQRQPPGSLDRMEKRIAAGDYEGALIEMGRAVGLTEEQIAERRAAPNWSQRVATVPTAIRESRIEEDWAWQSQDLSGIAVPTLLLTGSETPPELAEVTSVTAAAIPGARVHVLTGHGHVAHVSEPGVVAQVLRNWLQ
jgi:pimeloyl-ACP methyl ester carboxylesterase